jgi:hypothetical protein
MGKAMLEAFNARQTAAGQLPGQNGGCPHNTGAQEAWPPRKGLQERGRDRARRTVERRPLRSLSKVWKLCCTLTRKLCSLAEQ